MKCPFCGMQTNDLSAHAESCNGSPDFLHGTSDSFSARRMGNRVSARLQTRNKKGLIAVPAGGVLIVGLALAVFWRNPTPPANSQPVGKIEGATVPTVVEIADSLREPQLESYAAYRLKDSRQYLEAYP